MLYDKAQEWLGWPGRDQAFDPEGGSPAMTAEFAKKKIGGALQLAHPGVEVNVGILAPNSRADNSEAPLALVCEFPRGASDAELALAHRLAWNFSRTTLLITLEPSRLIAWSCLQNPQQAESLRKVVEVNEATAESDQDEIRSLLHWIGLVTNQIQQERPKHFPADGRADALLLKNLRFVRQKLIKEGLSPEFCHDLLARIIFTQFLFHRKDSDGTPFFSSTVLNRLVSENVLSRSHDSLASILKSKQDTYSLFRWMDARFNGDLFPGKSDEDEVAKENAWNLEKAAVSKDHLNILAEFISGTIDVKDRQLRLWPEYSFDTIPLEFISSVYEEFLNERKFQNKAYYTPSHLVDYVLDAVLPWQGQDWDLKILDPCCGSGIFLVKAFQRLIHRWRKVHKREPLVTDLRPILANNLVGVDKDPEAVRVACFSLYLAMADAIEPRHYVTRGDNSKVFPFLRSKRLHPHDFFDETHSGFTTHADSDSFDLVVGNAPWGDGSSSNRVKRKKGEPVGEKQKKPLPTAAETWAKSNGWQIVNNDIGPLFLAKAAALVKESGRVAMINTASILYWRDESAHDLRSKLFLSFSFDEVTNLSALRRELFPQAIGPSCTFVYGKKAAKPEASFYYYVPKPLRLSQTRGKQVRHGFTIEPQDVNTLTHEEAADNPCIWSVLAMGGRRDLNLVRRLRSYPTLKKLEKQGVLLTRNGVLEGDKGKLLVNELEDPQERRYLSDPKFPFEGFLRLDARKISKWKSPRIDSKGSTDFEAFKAPQLLIKKILQAKTLRLQSALVESGRDKWGVVCKESYVTVRELSAKPDQIQRAWVALNNSYIAPYFLTLTTNIGVYITKASVDDLLSVPLPKEPVDVEDVSSMERLDEIAKASYSLTTAEWQLIDDFREYTLPDSLRKTPGKGRQPTLRKSERTAVEPELFGYCETVLRAVKATFGESRAASMTIYSENGSARLPVRMVTVHLNKVAQKGVSIEKIDSSALFDELKKFYDEQLTLKTRRSMIDGGLGFQRVAYLVRSDQKGGVSLTLIKPDERRYWLRSIAMRDADQVASLLFKAADKKR